MGWALGSMRDLPLILETRKPLHVIVAPDRLYDHLPMDRLVESQIREDVSVETGVQAYERLTGKLAIEALTTGTILFSSDFNPSPFKHLFSRISSLIATGIALPLVLPLMGLLALAIKLDSPGPVLYIQERTGLGGRKFRLLKFRSMRLATASHTEWEQDNLDRITRTGKWLRKFRLDELPQFINVLRGDMNLVGPRPHPSSNRELFTLVSRNAQQDGEQIPYYSLRCSVRPGITGWAQVRYKYANGIEEEIEKLRYDLYYIKHYTPSLDLKILYQTVKVVLFGHVQVKKFEAAVEPVDDIEAQEPKSGAAEPTEGRKAGARQWWRPIRPDLTGRPRI